jgi:hypothetical protein
VRTYPEYGIGAAIGHSGEFDQPSSKTLQAGLSSLSSPDGPSHPEVRLYPSSFAGHAPTCSHGVGPKYLIRDNESKFGVTFARVAKTSSIELLKTPYHAPRANAICERFLGSVRRECLDCLLILHEKQLHRVLNAYIAYFDQARPHQGIRQQIPDSAGTSRDTTPKGSKVVAVPILAGLHHDYRKAA